MQVQNKVDCANQKKKKVILKTLLCFNKNTIRFNQLWVKIVKKKLKYTLILMHVHLHPPQENLQT